MNHMMEEENFERTASYLGSRDRPDEGTASSKITVLSFAVRQLFNLWNQHVMIEQQRIDHPAEFL